MIEVALISLLVIAMAGFAIDGPTMRTLRWIAGVYAALVLVAFGAVAWLVIERTPADIGPWAKYQITKRIKLSEIPLVDDCVAVGVSSRSSTAWCWCDLGSETEPQGRSDRQVMIDVLAKCRRPTA